MSQLGFDGFCWFTTALHFSPVSMSVAVGSLIAVPSLHTCLLGILTEHCPFFPPGTLNTQVLDSDRGRLGGC